MTVQNLKLKFVLILKTRKGHLPQREMPFFLCLRKQTDLLRLTVHHANTPNNPSIRNHAAANDTRSRIRVLTCYNLTTHDIYRATKHVTAGRRNNSILLCVYRFAEFIPLTFRNSKRITVTEATVRAVCLSPRRSIVASRDDFIVLHDDCPVFSPEAGGTLKHSLRDSQIVHILVNSFSHLKISLSFEYLDCVFIYDMQTCRM